MATGCEFRRFVPIIPLFAMAGDNAAILPPFVRGQRLAAAKSSRPRRVFVRQSSPNVSGRAIARVAPDFAVIGECAPDRSLRVPIAVWKNCEVGR